MPQPARRRVPNPKPGVVVVAARREADADDSRRAWLVAVAAVTALLAAAVWSSVASADELWTTDFAAAQDRARAEGKPLLLDFTGSDWCGPCIQMDERVFQSDAFREQAPQRYVLVKLDFPANKPQTEAVKRQNAGLQERYAVRGYPTVLLADAEGRPYFQTSGYGGQTPDAYLAMLADADEDGQALAEALAAAASLEGVAKAEALDRGLSSLDRDTALQHYGEAIDELVEAARQGDSPLDEKWLEAKRGEAFTQAVQGKLQGTGSPERALTALEEVMAEYDPQGEALQQALMMKSNIVYTLGRVEEAESLLRDARAAAPASSMAVQIDQILAQYFSADAQAEAPAEAG